MRLAFEFELLVVELSALHDFITDRCYIKISVRSLPADISLQLELNLLLADQPVDLLNALGVAPAFRGFYLFQLPLVNASDFVGILFRRGGAAQERRRSGLHWSCWCFSVLEVNAR